MKRVMLKIGAVTELSKVIFLKIRSFSCGISVSALDLFKYFRKIFQETVI